jgi:hypothetical protein
MKETVWKSNLNFVKNVYTIYENFIITVIVDSEKKIRKYYFRPVFVFHPNNL